MTVVLDDALEDARALVLRRGDVVARCRRAEQRWSRDCRDLLATPEDHRSDDQRWRVVSGLFRVRELLAEVEVYNDRMGPALRVLGLEEP